MAAIVHPSFSDRKQIERDLRVAVVARYAERLQRAGLWRRLVLQASIEREFRAELRKRFPPSANYGRHAIVQHRG